MSRLQAPFPALVVALIAAAATAQTPTCPGTGLPMTVIGGRFGDAWSLSLAGPPNAPALIGIDPAPGSIVTPLGTVCLGLSSGLILVPATLDSLGNTSLSGVLPLSPPGLTGATLSVQAAVAHPAYPSGFGLTNSSTITFRPPRIAAFKTSVSSSIGVTLGSITEVDAVTDAVVLSVQQPVLWTAPARVPKLGWFAAQTMGGMSCFDDLTGTLAHHFPGALPGLGAYLGPGFMGIEASADGSRLIAAQAFFAPHIAEFSLPNGTPTSTFTLPPGPFGLNILKWVRQIEGTTLTYAGTTSYTLVIDGSTGSVLNTIPLTMDFPPFVVGQFLYGLSSAGLVAINGATQTVALGPTSAPGINPLLLAAGPGPTGASVYVMTGDLTTGLAIFSLDVGTFTVTGSVAVPGYVLSMHLTAGGTEWLVVLQAPTGKDLHVMSPSTLQMSLFLPSVSSAALVLRSDTMRKAYVRVGPNDIVAFPTDPIGPPGPPIAIGEGTLVSN